MKRTPTAVLVAAMFAAVYGRYGRPAVLILGASSAEAEERWPGDELLEDAAGVSTRAIDIAAPPSAVWPWLAQMDPFPRGGAYTYDALGGGRLAQHVATLIGSAGAKTNNLDSRALASLLWRGELDVEWMGAWRHGVDSPGSCSVWVDPSALARMRGLYRRSRTNGIQRPPSAPGL